MVAFTTAMIAPGVSAAGSADPCNDAGAPYAAKWSSGEDYSTATGWLCMPLPMRLAIYDDVDTPVDAIAEIIGAFVELRLLA